MEPPLVEEDDIRQAEDDIRQDYECAKSFFQGGDHIRALQITEESISVHGKNKSKISAFLHSLQGTIFSKLARETEDNYVKCAYLFSAVESSTKSTLLFPDVLEFIHSCAHSLFELGEQLASNMYYEKAAFKASEGLSLDDPEDMLDHCIDLPSGSQGNLNHQERIKNLRKELEDLIKLAEARKNPNAERTVVDFSIKVKENKSNSRSTQEWRKKAEMRRSKTQNAVAEGLRSLWEGMSVKSKKDFMKVSIERLKCYVEELYGREGREALERGLDFARTSRKWKLWRCGTCSKEFRRAAECKKHLQQEHATKFRPSPKDVTPQKVDETWAEMVCAGEWKPVNTAVAVNMIKDQLPAVKEFVYVKGWSEEWPLANDEERGNLLSGIHQALKLFLEHECLSFSFQDWMMHYAFKQFGLLGVPRQDLEDSGLAKTPQCICFFDLHRLEQVTRYLGRFRTDVSTDLLSKAVDGVWESSRVKERINFDNEFSCLLLDKRLLRGKVEAFDDEGILDVCASGDHYTRVSPQGDEIISWFLDCPQIDEEYKFHRPIREHNLDIWLAVSRIIESKCRTLENKYHKKSLVHGYADALIQVMELCNSEDERRKNIPEDQWDGYASVLCNRCDELVIEDAGNSDATILFLSAVRDILEGTCYPRFGCFQVEEYLTSISVLSDMDDDFVSESVDMLRIVISDKIPLIDSKILLADNSRSQLLNDLTRLSIFDYRSFIIPLLKCFLRDELDKMMEMDAKERSAAAEAALLSEIEQEKKKSLLSKKKKKKENKIHRKEVDRKDISTGTSSPLDQEVELESSVTHESEITDELMKTEEVEHIEHASSKDEENITEDACPGHASCEDKENVTDDVCPQLMKTEEEERIEHVSSKDEESIKEDAYPEHEHVSSKDRENITVDACPEDEFSSANGLLKDSFKTDNPKETTTEEVQALPGSKSLENRETSDTKNDFQTEDVGSSTQLMPEPTEDAIMYDSALDMLLKSLWNIKVLREELARCAQPVHNHLEDRCVPCALRDLFSAFVTGQMNDGGLYHYLLNDLRLALKGTHPMANGSAELLIAILDFLHSWKSPQRESLATSLFTLEEFERMSCNRCRRKPNYPEQSSFGLVISANSLRELKFAFGNLKFEDLLKAIRLNFRMYCDTRTGGCGKRNYVRHALTKFPAIFTIALEWENNETREEIYATAMALDTEIDISVLYSGVKPMTKYRLVSMVGCSEKEYNCIAYENGRWVRHDPSAKEEIGNWKDVIRFCKQRKIRPEILFLEAGRSPNKF